MREKPDKKITIRNGIITDLEMIVPIYNYYIENTAITFETQTFDTARCQIWFDQFKPAGPHRLLVIETEAGVIGYCCSTKFKDRQAYQTLVETSIYLDPHQVGRGFGALLYRALFDELKQEISLHRAYAGITMPNPASVALHKKLGFKQVGLFEQVGYKRDRFWDVTMYENPLDSSAY